MESSEGPAGGFPNNALSKLPLVWHPVSHSREWRRRWCKAEVQRFRSKTNRNAGRRRWIVATTTSDQSSTSISTLPDRVFHHAYLKGNLATDIVFVTAMETSSMKATASPSSRTWKVKGTSETIKRGTMVKNIRLNGKPGEIEAAQAGQGSGPEDRIRQEGVNKREARRVLTEHLTLHSIPESMSQNDENKRRAAGRH